MATTDATDRQPPAPDAPVDAHRLERVRRAAGVEATPRAAEHGGCPVQPEKRLEQQPEWRSACTASRHRGVVWTRTGSSSPLGSGSPRTPRAPALARTSDSTARASLSAQAARATRTTSTPSRHGSAAAAVRRSRFARLRCTAPPTLREARTAILAGPPASPSRSRTCTTTSAPARWARPRRTATMSPPVVSRSCVAVATTSIKPTAWPGRGCAGCGGWNGPPASASAHGTRACARDGGCWAGRCASRRSTPDRGGRRSSEDAIARRCGGSGSSRHGFGWPDRWMTTVADVRVRGSLPGDSHGQQPRTRSHVSRTGVPARTGTAWRPSPTPDSTRGDASPGREPRPGRGCTGPVPRSGCQLGRAGCTVPGRPPDSPRGPERDRERERPGRAENVTSCAARGRVRGSVDLPHRDLGAPRALQHP